MNTVELLLKGDAGKLELPTREVEIKRMTELYGEPVIFKLRALSHSEYQEVTEAVTVKSNGSVSLSGSSNERIAVAGIVEPNLRDKALKDHYKALNPIDLLEKLCLPGEIVSFANEIIELSGFNEGDTVREVEEIKN